MSRKKETDSGNEPPRRGRLLWIGFLLIAAVVFVYQEAPKGEFLVRHDDGPYVVNNDGVNRGLSLEGLKWAFSAFHAANWHPLTWISHQIDVELFGMKPWGHHLTNLVLHGLNTVLLFLFLAGATRRRWRSGFVAALFAVHPLHVESVAWIAERKDLLSAFFMMLTLLAYGRYAQRRGIGGYLVVFALLCCGLMAKPMLVTVPFVLLLLDFWPLCRMGRRGAAGGAEETAQPALEAADGAGALPAFDPRRAGALLLEKAPLLAPVAASCLVTVFAQREGGAMQDLSWPARILNALNAYGEYLVKMIWPADLAALYPHLEGDLPFWRPAAAAAAIVLITAAAVRYGKKIPYLPVGWLWYLGTLVPVIGIVQVGNQAMADRYTYIPLVGIFILAAYGIPDLVGRLGRGGGPIRSILGAALPAAAVLVLLLLGAAAKKQVKIWRDCAALFTDALEKVENNYLAEHDLGMMLVLQGRPKEGLLHLERAVEIKPDWGPAHLNLAMVKSCLGRYEEAWDHIRLARQNGWEPQEEFLRDLEGRMKDPGLR